MQITPEQIAPLLDGYKSYSIVPIYIGTTFLTIGMLTHFIVFIKDAYWDSVFQFFSYAVAGSALLFAVLDYTLYKSQPAFIKASEVCEILNSQEYNTTSLGDHVLLYMEETKTLNKLGVSVNTSTMVEINSNEAERINELLNEPSK